MGLYRPNEGSGLCETCMATNEVMIKSLETSPKNR